jgi:hypothetical protein
MDDIHEAFRLAVARVEEAGRLASIMAEVVAPAQDE